MKKDVRARIFEMTLAAFGASACAGAAQSSEPSKLPTAAEVTKPTAASPGEASCSAAGCGGNADTASAAPAAAPASPAAPAASDAPAMAAKSETTPEVTQKAETGNAVAAPAATAAAAPAKAKPKHVPRKKAADDEGCGAGSCASQK